jgi:hypothetical protein
MFLDSELRDIEEAKKRLSARCGLRRQLVLLEVRSTWASVRRKVVSATFGISLGIFAVDSVLSYLRKRKASTGNR